MIAVVVAAGAFAVALRWRPPPARLLVPRTRARPRRRPTTTADEWATFLDAIAAEVRGGAGLSAALTHAEHRLGRTLPTRQASSAPPDRDTAVVLQVVDAATVLGGPVAATLDTGAAVLRERSIVRAELAAHAAQGRLSARVLTAVPLCFAAFSLATSESFRSAFLSPVGLTAALAGGACNTAGWWWMRHLIAKASP